jgi:hypothetical protein
MKNVLAVTVALFLVACASLNSRWASVAPGMSKDEVVALMGNPKLFNEKSLAWEMDAFTGCWVNLGVDGKVKEKICHRDEEAYQRDQQARAQAWQNYLQQASRDQERKEQLEMQRRPTSTNCTTRQTYGNNVETNCTSY